jgi:Ca2+-binding RTX toxin-like protein
LQLSSAGSNSVQLGAQSSGTFDSILGGSANDDIDLSGRTSATALYAGAGSDKVTVNNSNGISQLSTQSGADTIVVSAAALTTTGVIDQMSGGSNEDSLILSDVLDTGLKDASVASIYNQGGSVSYELEGTSEELYQDQTKVVSIDKLQLANGANKVLLGAKSQRALTDEVIGGSQNDVILADSNVFKALKLDGGDGNDMLGGSSGNDSLIGGNGNDTLIAGAGADTMIGGAGIDKFRIDSSQFRSNDSIDGGTNIGGVDVLELWGKSAVNDGAFAGVKAIEKLVVVGNNLDSTLNTSAMSVQLGALARASGLAEIVVQDGDGAYLDLAQLTSANTVTGGTGADSIVGFAGADTLNGGSGSDTLILNATSTDLNRAGNDQLVYIENIDASKSLSGVLINLAIQSETLSINGGNFSDTITGGLAADALNGGAGADSLVGGAGADRFIYSTLTDSLAGSSASTSGDTINDFVSATDKIDVSAASLTAIQAVGGAGLLSGTGYTAAGTSNLGADIATAIGTGGGTLLANGAAIVNITTGTGAGNYLVLNNGTAGYSASDDAVIFLGSSSVVAGDFI